MKKNIQTTIVEYNRIASNIYSNVVNEFSAAVGQLNRKKDDNVFRMQAAKYQLELKKRLESEAAKQMEEAPEFREEVRMNLTGIINYYLQTFQIRCGEF